MTVLTLDFHRVPIPGYEGLYEACSSGRIWSVEREVVAGRHKHSTIKRGGKYLSPSTYGRYPIVTLCKDGIIRHITLHSLIALAFLGPRPEGLVINHIDGNKANNSPSNLEYVTQLENRRHAQETGLQNFTGRNNPNYKHGRYCNERQSINN